MKATLKKYLIPHEGNDHKPYLLRHEAVLGLVLVAVIAQVLFLGNLWGVSGGALVGNITATALARGSNAEREDAGLPDLAVNPLLAAAAQAKANDMVTEGYFAHYSPEGVSPWSWISGAGYRYEYAGENLAVNFTDSDDVTQAWMNSPDHRANILNAHYTEVGFATAKGTYKGHEATFVVQMFASPAVVTKPVAVAPTQEPVTAPAPKPATPAPATIRTAVLPHAQAVEAAAQTSAEPATTTTSTVAAADLSPIPVAYAQEVAGSTESTPSPKRFLYAFYGLLAAIFAVALVLKVFVKIRVQHPRLILNGVLALAVIAGLVWVSEYATLAHALIG